MYVNEAMTTDLKTCGPQSSLDEVARLMWNGDCGAIPVVTDDNRPMGIITDRDIAMAAMINHQPLWEMKAESVIQHQQLCCCGQQESVESCLSRMEQNEVRRVLVIDAAGCLVGILSMGDALAFARPDNSIKKTDKVDVDNVLDMLKRVSAHHPSGNKPPQRVSEQKSEYQSGIGRQAL